MRIFALYTKTTLKEDKEIYRAVVDAANKGPNDHQNRILSQVVHHHLEHNRDLTTDLYYAFVAVLEDLDVKPPSVAINDHNAEAGSWYAIPALGKFHKGQGHQERMAARAAKRQSIWSQIIELSPFTSGELKLLLAPPETEMGEMRELVISEVNDVDDKIDALTKAFNQKIEALNNRIEALEAAL
ncbi:hypothetical protein [Thalassobius sp. I31.1]|uniref:hypothetical protein n=1 Tax=Thalassobius sp. I31.1 TaxID=2109912 RepID=UPI000D19B19A|nr:hypothetical protein [Thalassobius sp. I31.1]